jgi:hypothetical protein
MRDENLRMRVPADVKRKLKTISDRESRLSEEGKRVTISDIGVRAIMQYLASEAVLAEIADELKMKPSELEGKAMKRLAKNGVRVPRSKSPKSPE